MDTLYLSIAGFIIALTFEEPEIADAKSKYLIGFLRYHKNFIYVSPPERVDFEIEVTWDDNQEIVIREREGKFFINYCKKVGAKKIRTYYQTSIYQFQTMLRDIVQDLLSESEEGYIFHASSSVINKKIYVFTGSSGAGKSTIAALASKKFSVFTDDALIIKKESGIYWCYQTPFLEKNIHINKNANGYPLHGIYILKKSEEYSLDKIDSKHTIFKKLAKQLYTTKYNNKKQLESLFTFVMREDRFYHLSFAKNEKQVINLLTKNNEKV